jgi:hypothetical protein
MHLCMDIDCALHPYASMDLCVCMHGYDYLDIICNVAYCILLHVMQCIVLQRSVCMRVYIYIRYVCLRSFWNGYTNRH